MSKNEVRTAKLEAARVVSAYGYGEEPEAKSHAAMREFFEVMGWHGGQLKQHRIFGFNNPDPSEGTGSYGYEHWITVDEEFALPAGIADGISLKEMPGGLYATLESPGIPSPEKWAVVVHWLNGSEYQYDGSRQWLEEIVLNETGLGILTGKAQDLEALKFNLMSPIVSVESS